MLRDLILRNDNKIIFLVLDGLGDIPSPAFSNLTPLEAAQKPHMDTVSKSAGILGRIMPVDIGITPGSGPSHLSLFGYDPITDKIGRGVLEVLGLNMDLRDGDLAARANFCTVKDGIVVDRRAGRIPTEESKRLCAMLMQAIPDIDGVEVIIQPGKSHRFALILRGPGLSDSIMDADPHKDNRPIAQAEPREANAEFAAGIVNKFVKKAMEVLHGEKAANGVLLRGFSKKPAIPSFSVNYGMNALAIAAYPMYRGIAKLLGMDVKEEPRDYPDMTRILRENYGAYQFFFLHIKETDLAGEDGDFEAKRRAIEAVDALLPEIWALKPQVLVITGDHATPCVLKGHSWHPVPLLLASGTGESDGMSFHEKNCVHGSIGTIYSKQLMPLTLGYGLKLDKYGA
jgi:2,3-bisphosphoglycerate-independent phosphoglycerate mutase